MVITNKQSIILIRICSVVLVFFHFKNKTNASSNFFFLLSFPPMTVKCHTHLNQEEHTYTVPHVTLSILFFYKTLEYIFFLEKILLLVPQF